MAGPDERPGKNPNRQPAFHLGRVNDNNLRVAAKLRPVAVGGLGDLLGQGPAPVRVIPEKPRDHGFDLDQMF